MFVRAGRHVVTAKISFVQCQRGNAPGANLHEAHAGRRKAVAQPGASVQRCRVSECLEAMQAAAEPQRCLLRGQ